MTTAVILRRSLSGKRAFPIKVEAAESLVRDGLARLLKPKLYEAIDKGEPMPAPADGTYATRVMVAAAPSRALRRKG